ncbi:hypothetical protein H7K24_09100 [Mycobacterium fragae]|uniref:YiaAB two helix domain-containing protein n=1 Tax=Mycobacterium fragae TaxID=1260918 RepID=A0A1X1UHS8_9MYCO|nr:YiaA/YiaB family inner membrane protein [Mycobacterium fragae]MCV7400312.1 hypothetical protein [Mycobacterium fragae]ORV56383.1 hypothetical protein AWC06_03720 [Mycobacterium fragae]
MNTPQPLLRTSAAYFVQSGIAFAVSFGALAIGIAYLPMSGWQRAFLAICTLFLVTSCFNLAKVIRDQHEANQFRNRVDEARLEQMYVEHNPLKGVV